MSVTFSCVVLIAGIGLVQASGRRPAPTIRRDTIYVAVQSPPPAITVEAPSQWPVVVIGLATVLLLGVQLKIMARQTDILDRQTALAAQQAEWRVGEAVGTFVRLAHDLTMEFRKANVLPTMAIVADFETHPRQMLREASGLFAPLGPQFLVAANQAAMRLDEYFLAVQAYNENRSSRADRARYDTVQSLRAHVGGDLDLANSAIPKPSRWTYSDGSDYRFRSLCSPPPGFLGTDGTTV